MTAPTLSSTLARLLLNASPAHAFWNCPALNPAYVPEHKQEFDLGTAAHAWVLEGRTDRFVIVDAPNWKTKATQDAREAAWAASKTPLLVGQYRAMMEAVSAWLLQIAAFEESPRPLAIGGSPEHTLDWIEAGVHCRTRCDWLHADRKTVDDLKTTSGSAHPDVWSRTIWNSGLDIQAAFYLRGVRACHGKDAAFRFVVAELDAPYGLSVVGLEPEALALADRKVDRALALWKDCLARDSWPGYPKRVAYPGTPPWETARWEQREYNERAPAVVDDGRPIDEQLWGDKA